MRFPDVTESVATLFMLGRYSGARVLADPEVAKLAALIRTPHKAYKDAIQRRNDTADRVTDAEAVRDYQFDLFGDLVLDLGRSAIAHFKSREHSGFVRLFVVPPRRWWRLRSSIGRPRSAAL